MAKPNDTDRLQEIASSEGAIAGPQLTLDIGIEIERDVNGIEMGVLANGVAYLSERGLERIAGVTRKKLYDIRNDWEEASRLGIWNKKRILFIQDRLLDTGYNEPSLHLPIKKSGKTYYAIPDVVCMAILEYYAFEANTKSNTAIENYRRIARFGLQEFIYRAVGYSPGDPWKYHNDRVSLLRDASPAGYFSIFHETAGLSVDLINAGLTVNDKTLPDVSVGRAWGGHWTKNEISNDHGERVPYEHNFPNYYPQSASNPQSPWAYPDSALAEFRRWFREVYLLTKYPKYILTKANVLKGGKTEAKLIAELYQPKQLED